MPQTPGGVTSGLPGTGGKGILVEFRILHVILKDVVDQDIPNLQPGMYPCGIVTIRNEVIHDLVQ